MKNTCLLSLVFAFFIICNYSLGENFVFIKGGTFAMGSPENEPWRENDEILHKVKVSDFIMCKYEVSQEEFFSLMGTNPSEFKGKDLPVENVTWYEAILFCNARSESEGLQKVYQIEGNKIIWDKKANGYRLPTEAEWEYACRGGSNSAFNFGLFPTSEMANYYATYSYKDEPSGVYRKKTMPIDSFKPNSLGLFNMHGNVAEWCWDIYGSYDDKKILDPDGSAEGKLRLCRGGGWNDFGKHLRSAFRSAADPKSRMYNRGFRIVRNSNNE